MAKMFYSLEEAAQRLGKTVADVRAMAQRGEITEFRDGDRLIFKVDQIDLLSGDEGDANDMSSMIPLADSGSGMSLGLTDTGSGAPIGGDTKEKTGISVFDAEEIDNSDPSAQTQISDEPTIDNVTLESFGSGSGLMDLTRESDDTSLGAEGLLDELYTPGGTGAGASGAGTRTGTGGEGARVSGGDSGLFEGSPGTGDLVGVGAGEGAALVAVAPESYDGKGSGLVGGLAIGSIAALGLGLFAVLMGIMGNTPAIFTKFFDGNILIWVAALAGLTVLLGGLGFVLGKKD